VSIARTGANVAGEPLSTWMQRYWRWVRSFPKGESPTDDVQGTRCAAGQNGPVFFLTGSPGTGRISRECVVPRGTPVILPILNVLAQAGPAALAGCAQLLMPVRRVNESAVNLRFTSVGRELALPAYSKQETGCFDLVDQSNRGSSSLAMGAGHWLVLDAMEAGSYEIAFSGRYDADGFAQDIRYVLDVK
jgi:hypothetical protein